MTSSLQLPGLDAQNPLGYFAALGLLRVLDEHARRKRHERPRLWFLDDASLTAHLSTSLSLDDVCGLVLEDAHQQQANVALSLAYDASGQQVATDHASAIRDLKPPPNIAADLLRRAQQHGRRDADLAAALFSELAQDNNGKTKPTAFHFTAGQQAFLQMVEELRSGLTDAALREALIGPWLNTSDLPSLAWDASVSRLYALRASDPSKEKRGSVPAANWLGFQALSFFPVTVHGDRLLTTCVRGGWKDSVFVWPVWRGELTAPVIASLLRTDIADLTAAERDAAGIHAVFSARILRSDQGGYGSFSPAAVVLPRARHSVAVRQ